MPLSFVSFTHICHFKSITFPIIIDEIGLEKKTEGNSVHKVCPPLVNGGTVYIECILYSNVKVHVDDSSFAKIPSSAAK